MSKKNWWIVAGIGLAIGVVILLWKFVITEQQLRDAIDYLRSFGVWSKVVFFITYVVLVTLSFPSTILNIASGVLFSIGWAMGISITAALVGSCLCFLFARHMFKDAVCDKLAKLDNGEELLHIAEKKGWKLIVILRLNPFIPAVIKNYGFGVTDVPLREYATATLIGQIPLTALYTYIGWLGGRTMLDADAQPQGYHWAILIGGVIVSLILTYVVYRYTHQHHSSHRGPKKEDK